MMKSHVLIVTGLSSLRNGLQALMTAMPEIEVFGEAEDASSALQMVEEHHPDLVLVDMISHWLRRISLDVCNGTEHTEEQEASWLNVFNRQEMEDT